MSRGEKKTCSPAVTGVAVRRKSCRSQTVGLSDSNAGLSNPEKPIPQAVTIVPTETYDHIGGKGRRLRSPLAESRLKDFGTFADSLKYLKCGTSQIRVGGDPRRMTTEWLAPLGLSRMAHLPAAFRYYPNDGCPPDAPRGGISHGEARPDGTKDHSNTHVRCGYGHTVQFGNCPTRASLRDVG